MIALLIAAAAMEAQPLSSPSYRTCLWQQMFKLDDGKTSPDLMATTIEASCRREYLRMANSEWLPDDNPVYSDQLRRPTSAEMIAITKLERSLLIERIKVYRANPDLREKAAN